MKRVLFGLGLLALTSSLTSCQPRFVDIVSITRYSLTNESVQITSGDAIDSSFSIKVSYAVTDENDKVSKGILADGLFINGELKLSQSVTEPTEVRIDAYACGSSRSRGASTVLRPDSKIDFIVIRRVTNYSDYCMYF